MTEYKYFFRRCIQNSLASKVWGGLWACVCATCVCPKCPEGACWDACVCDSLCDYLLCKPGQIKYYDTWELWTFKGADLKETPRISPLTLRGQLKVNTLILAKANITQLPLSSATLRACYSKTNISEYHIDGWTGVNKLWYVLYYIFGRQ